MNEFVKSVLEFHELFNQPIGNLNVNEERKTRQLRIKLLFEELEELAEAGDLKATFGKLCADVTMKNVDSFFATGQQIEDGDNVDKIEELDALCDIQYVLAGKIITGGYQGVFDRNFETVHRNNMTKAHRSHEHAMETVEKNGLPKFEIIQKGNAFLLNNEHGKLTKPHDHIKVKISL
jgi:predicted HAD superfamily Cof-like phosphohydrolase